MSVFKPGDLVSEVVIWEVVSFDPEREGYQCKEREGNRQKFFPKALIEPDLPTDPLK